MKYGLPAAIFCLLLGCALQQKLNNPSGLPLSEDETENVDRTLSKLLTVLLPLRIDTYETSKIVEKRTVDIFYLVKVVVNERKLIVPETIILDQHYKPNGIYPSQRFSMEGSDTLRDSSSRNLILYRIKIISTFFDRNLVIPSAVMQCHDGYYASCAVTNSNPKIPMLGDLFTCYFNKQLSLVGWEYVRKSQR
jgi:hypothetical protein